MHYGNRSLDLTINESTYHGQEIIHALEYIRDTSAELIEVQVGSYLREDNFVRFEDNYGRIWRENEN